MEHVNYGVLCRRVSILNTFAIYLYIYIYICICSSFRAREDPL